MAEQLKGAVPELVVHRDRRATSARTSCSTPRSRPSTTSRCAARSASPSTATPTSRPCATAAPSSAPRCRPSPGASGACSRRTSPARRATARAPRTRPRAPRSCWPRPASGPASRSGSRWSRAPSRSTSTSPRSWSTSSSRSAWRRTLKQVETAQWHPLVTRREFQIGANLTGLGVDDPDANFYENYACGSPRNYTDYCNEEMDAADRAAVAGARPGEARWRSSGRSSGSSRRTWRGR